MVVLGIETTCDETAAAVVERPAEGPGRILSNIVLSQIDEHAAFGGVVPEIAARAHVEALDVVIAKAMADAGVSFAGLDGVAAAAGPGLIGGVIVGLTTAKAIALVNEKPLIAVNHLEAHALTARLTDDTPFPYCLFLASGGHTQIVAITGIGEYERLGSTMDDAIGEAFDKTAKLLGLGYPGGPQVEKEAVNGNPQRFSLPRPMLGKPNADFSLSGLKTALRLEAEKIAPISDQDVRDLCASFQQAVVDVVADRLRAGLKLFRAHCGNPTALVAAGGVAANGSIRSTHRRTRAGHCPIWSRAQRPRRAKWFEPMSFDKIAVIGAGAWGVALANVITRAGRSVTLAARDAQSAAVIGERRESPRLPGIKLHDQVRVTPLNADITSHDAILLAVPAQQLRAALTTIAPALAGGTPVIACAKGIERGTHKFMTEVIAEGAPSALPAILSGPSFATDVARGLPTAVTLAAADDTVAAALAQALGSVSFRPYHTTDVRGVEIGGAAKNVLGIAAGIVSGRGLGASAAAALTTRGFAELF